MAADRREVILRCAGLVAIVEYEGARPVAMRRRCRNRRCCPPRDGRIAVHRWDLETGRYTTEYVAAGPNNGARA